MNNTKIQNLLRQWKYIIDNGKKSSIKKASISLGGLTGRIRRTTGTPVIFDFEAYNKQLKIQKSLCIELPELAGLINSTPEIMDGYQWTRSDFIDLYFSHYHLVITKLESFIGEKTDV
jgi:hypothetical protein